VKIDGGFAKRVLIAFCMLAGVAAYPLAKFGSRDVIVAAITGSFLSTINVLLGYAAIEYSLDKPHSTFFRAVVGGMGLRILVMVGALLMFIKVLGMHAMALTVSLLSFYIVYLVLEVWFIQKKLSLKSQP